MISYIYIYIYIYIRVRGVPDRDISSLCVCVCLLPWEGRVVGEPPSASPLWCAYTQVLRTPVSAVWCHVDAWRAMLKPPIPQKHPPWDSNPRPQKNV